MIKRWSTIRRCGTRCMAQLCRFVRPLGAAVIAFRMHANTAVWQFAFHKFGLWHPRGCCRGSRIASRDERYEAGEQLPHNTSCGINLRPKACPDDAWHSTDADGALVWNLARLSPTLQYFLPNLLPPPSFARSPLSVLYRGTLQHTSRNPAFALLLRAALNLLCPSLVSPPPSWPACLAHAAPRNRARCGKRQGSG